jgi:hypothetical protein
MTGNGMSDLPGAPELRLLIREVLRDALAAGHLKAPSFQNAPPSSRPATPPAGARDTSPQQPQVQPAAPPSDIPAGTIQQTGLRAGGPRAPGALVAPGPAASRAAESASTAGGSAPRPASSAGTRHVRLATDEDLHQFVLTVVRLADNPARRRDLLTGRLRFTLSGSPGGPAPGSQPRQAAFRIETGAVTERAVQAAAKAGERLVLGRRAVLTPLARDRALSLGVPIERER